MTVIEKIKEAIKNADMESDNVEKLIAAAYYIGREEAAKEICDKARDIFTAQQERAAKCRYHNTAMTVQGGISSIFSADYAQDYTTTFGNDNTDI